MLKNQRHSNYLQKLYENTCFHCFEFNCVLEAKGNLIRQAKVNDVIEN